MRSRPFRRYSNRGFTFLEIILVVSIIVMLAGIVGTSLVGKSKDARIKAARIQMGSIKTSLQAFEIEVGRFPSSDEGLQALVTRPGSVDEQDWSKGMERLPKDAWKEPFKYAYPSTHGLDFDLTSKGPDRTEGTEDDINNWDGIDTEGLGS